MAATAKKVNQLISRGSNSIKAQVRQFATYLWDLHLDAISRFGVTEIDNNKKRSKGMWN